MRRATVTLVILVFLAACAGKKTESRQAEQPTEVAGGFGLTMQCSVLNHDDNASTSSSIGCLVYNDDGSRFTGSIAETSAEIVTSSGKVITAAQIVSGSSAGSYSIGIEVSNLKPSDAATIRISANFDNIRRILVASLMGRLATTCYEDVTYYVHQGAQNTQNISCLKDSPCSTINQALKLIPDIINCEITIDVRAGKYNEAILVDTKQLQSGGRLILQGREGERPIISQPNGHNQHIDLVALDNPSLSADSAVKLRNIELQGQGVATGGNAVTLSSTNLALENVIISGYQIAIHASANSSVFLKDVTITNSGGGLISVSDLRTLRFAGEINLVGSPTAQSADSTRSSYPGIQILGANLVSLGDPFTLKLKNFDHGLFLARSSFYLQEGQRIELENVGTGITLDNARLYFVDKNINTSTLTLEQKKIFDQNVPMSIVMKDFSASGLNLINNAELNDGTISTSSSKPKITLTATKTSSASPAATQIISATDLSSIVLIKSDLDFCLPTSGRVTSTPWHNSTNNRAYYAMTINSASDAVFDWSSNPFKKTADCTPVDTSLAIQTYSYRFAPPTYNNSVCPIGYSKASDNICYGSMGHVRHSGSGKFFGVLEGDSRIDNLTP